MRRRKDYKDSKHVSAARLVREVLSRFVALLSYLYRQPPLPPRRGQINSHGHGLGEEQKRLAEEGGRWDIPTILVGKKRFQLTAREA